MELKDRKKINNLPKLQLGQVGSYLNSIQPSTVKDWTGWSITPRSAIPVDYKEPKGTPFESGVGPLSPEVYEGASDNGFIDRKNFLNNPGAGAGPWFALGAWLGGGLAQGLTATKRANELLSDAGTGEGNVGGIQYQRQNAVDGNAAMKEYDTSIALDFLTSPTSALGKLFTRGKQKREIARAQSKATNINNLNRSGAFTEALQQDYNLNHIDTRNSMFKDGKDAVETAYGTMYAPQNAWVNKGEYIWDGGNNLQYVDHGKNDTAKANINPEDTVFTTKYGIADMVPYAAMTGQLPQLAQYQKMMHQNKFKNGKDCIKLKYGWDNILTNGFGALSSIGQYIDAARQDIKIPNIYAKNKYGNRALNTLAGLHPNQYPLLQQMNQAYNNARYDINRSGGQSGAQRYLANVALGVQNQRNIANTLAQLQNQDLGYRQNYANVAAQMGAQEAANRQAANQYREQYAAASHAAKQQGKQMGIRNLMDYVNTFYKNRFKLDQFNRMYNLYAQDVSNTSKNISNLLNYSYS